MRYFFVFFAFFFVFQASAKAEPVSRIGTNGNQFQTQDGKAVSLRGVSLCSLEWHKPLEQIEQVTSSPDKWAVNILRLPVQVKEWDRVGADNYIKGYLDPAIQMCRQKNIHCIIDWHEIGAWDNAENIKKLEDFWTRVAPRYAADRNIAYEIFNEPTEPKARTLENWLSWRTQMQKWVDSIRKDAPLTLLLIGSPHWSQMPSFAVEHPVQGNNIAYVMHLYPNFSVKEWDELFGTAAEKIPLILTEWGWSTQEKAKGQVIAGTRESYGEPLKAYLDTRPQIGWTAWSYDPLCGPAMLGADQDMGIFVKEWLEEKITQ
jgi:hypothetical protein